MNNVDVDEINELAQFIRQINGDNKMGAAELAENILEWQSGKAHDVEPVGEISEINGCPTVYWDKSLPVGTKFYSRPAAKVPEETEEMVDAAVKVFEDAGADVDLGWLGEACRAYVAAASTTPQQSGEDWIKIIEANCWDLVCVSEPTGCGDADVVWQVIEHHMAEPKERVLAADLCPVRALENALNPPKQEGE